MSLWITVSLLALACVLLLVCSALVALFYSLIAIDNIEMDADDWVAALSVIAMWFVSPILGTAWWAIGRALLPYESPVVPVVAGALIFGCMVCSPWWVISVDEEPAFGSGGISPLATVVSVVALSALPTTALTFTLIGPGLLASYAPQSLDSWISWLIPLGMTFAAAIISHPLDLIHFKVVRRIEKSPRTHLP